VIDAQRSHTAHRKLSSALAAFASAVDGLVDAHEGSLIYSGGDDVLALLPLHRALPFAEELARLFASSLAGWAGADGRAPTLSAGLAVVHHLMPLDEALEVARRAERAAKQDAGRDALCVEVVRRGGTPVRVYGHWQGLVPRLRELVRLRRRDAISAKAGYELMTLDRLAEDAGAAVEPLLRSEALRILRRKRAEAGGAEVDEAVLASLEAMLDAVGSGVRPAALGRELYVAEVLARAEDQAQEEER
jgi:CRISPR-associated protein Cmr2